MEHDNWKIVEYDLSVKRKIGMWRIYPFFVVARLSAARFELVPRLFGRELVKLLSVPTGDIARVETIEQQGFIVIQVIPKGSLDSFSFTPRDVDQWLAAFSEVGVSTSHQKVSFALNKVTGYAFAALKWIMVPLALVLVIALRINT